MRQDKMGELIALGDVRSYRIIVALTTAASSRVIRGEDL